MKKITLENDFHNTSINLIPILDLANEFGGDELHLSRRQVRRAREALCGVSGCTCSGNAGTRGSQRFDIWMQDDGSAIVYHDALAPDGIIVPGEFL